MSHPIQTIAAAGSVAITMTSLELVDFINEQRDTADPELRHDHFMVKVPKVLGEIHAPKFLGTQVYGNNNTRPIYKLPKREACLMAMSYSYELQAKVFDRMTALETQVAAPLALTPAEMFLQNAQAMVAVERRQLAQAQELARISESVDTLMTGSMTLTERPANSEAITHIRPRMLKKYQLPARIVDLVMRQMPYSPKPAGMVRNHREEAQGTSYAVYWVKDVNTTFSRFVRDCKRVTATKVTHPDIDERFTLAPGAED